jgi:hypothetical protein
MAAGDITDALSASLGIRLEDPAEDIFTADVKIEMLNKALVQLTNLLHDGYFTELEAVTMGQVLTGSSYVAFSTLTAGILRGKNGIKRIKVTPGGVAANAKWAIEADLSNIKETENTFRLYSDARPMYFCWMSRIYVLCTTYTSTTIDVHYMKIPTSMSTTVDPVINSSLHSILVLLAEALCWNANGALPRADAAMSVALDEIDVLNKRYTDPEGLGTKNRK